MECYNLHENLSRNNLNFSDFNPKDISAIYKVEQTF